MSKLIHRIWLGPHHMTDKCIEYGYQWADLNPDWQVIDWDEHMLLTQDWTEREELPLRRNLDVIKDLKRRDNGREGVELYVQMADVLAYDLIYTFGGIVVNVDIEPVKPMSALFERYQVGDDAYAPYEDDQFIVNAVLGGPREHPFWGYVLDRLAGSYFAKPGEEMVKTTGPQFLTRCVREWEGSSGYVAFEGRGRFTALPKDSFNAVHWGDIPLGHTADGMWSDSPDVIGLHHWNHRFNPRTNIVENATKGIGTGIRVLG